MRPLMSYDWKAISRNKGREAWHRTRHTGWQARDVVRYRMLPVLLGAAGMVAVAVLLVALAVVRLVWPSAYRSFLEN